MAGLGIGSLIELGDMGALAEESEAAPLLGTEPGEEPVYPNMYGSGPYRTMGPSPRPLWNPTQLRPGQSSIFADASSEQTYEQGFHTPNYTPVPVQPVEQMMNPEAAKFYAAMSLLTAGAYKVQDLTQEHGPAVGRYLQQFLPEPPDMPKPGDPNYHTPMTSFMRDGSGGGWNTNIQPDPDHLDDIHDHETGGVQQDTTHLNVPLPHDAEMDDPPSGDEAYDPNIGIHAPDIIERNDGDEVGLKPDTIEVNDDDETSFMNHLYDSINPTISNISSDYNTGSASSFSNQEISDFMSYNGRSKKPMNFSKKYKTGLTPAAYARSMNVASKRGTSSNLVKQVKALIHGKQKDSVATTRTAINITTPVVSCLTSAVDFATAPQANGVISSDGDSALINSVRIKGYLMNQCVGQGSPTGVCDRVVRLIVVWFNKPDIDASAGGTLPTMTEITSAAINNAASIIDMPKDHSSTAGHFKILSDKTWNMGVSCFSNSAGLAYTQTNGVTRRLIDYTVKVGLKQVYKAPGATAPMSGHFSSSLPQGQISKGLLVLYQCANAEVASSGTITTDLQTRVNYTA